MIAPKQETVAAAAADANDPRKQLKKLTRRDFVPPVDVRWCPGCGDYAILNTIQNLFPSLGIPRENFVVISGIGCSSRFPYYMNTYGFHTIHGRAPTVATGVRVANPDLSVWVVTGDGDGLSIGGNHMLHLLRRNLDLTILLFNNKIYGLTKGQYSPTSELGMKKKTTPDGSIDQPLNPLAFALAAEATFVARTYDRNPKHMAQVFKAAAAHKGTAFVEILQNCVIFNDGAWDPMTEREVRDDRLLLLEDGKPLVFGRDQNKGIRLRGLEPEVVELAAGGGTEDLLVHQVGAGGELYANLLARMEHPRFPVPVGVLRAVSRPTYEDRLARQIHDAVETRDPRNLQALLIGRDYWEVRGEDEKIEARKQVGARERSRVDDSLADEMAIMDEQSRETTRFRSDPLLGALRTRVNSLKVTYGTGRVIPIRPEDSVATAITLLKEYKLDSLLVVKDRRLVGIVTSRDILLKVVLKEMDRENTKVTEIMTPRPEIAAEWNSVGDAINKMAIGRFRHLPIEHAGGHFGMISAQDLLGFVYKKALGRKS